MQLISEKRIASLCTLSSVLSLLCFVFFVCISTARISYFSRFAAEAGTKTI